MSKKKRRSKRSRSKKSKNYMWLAALTVVSVVVVGIMITSTQKANACETIDAFEAQVGGPQAYIAQDVINHGDVKLNTTVTSVFTIANVGDETLHILGEPQVQLKQGC